MVQTVTEDGQVTDHSTKESVETAIWEEIHGRRFYPAEHAPICQGLLRGILATCQPHLPLKASSPIPTTTLGATTSRRKSS